MINVGVREKTAGSVVVLTWVVDYVKISGL